MVAEGSVVWKGVDVHTPPEFMILRGAYPLMDP
jgi:hypothetical protein